MSPLEIAMTALEELREAAERHLAEPSIYSGRQLRFSLDRAKAAQRTVTRAQTRELLQGSSR